MGFKKKLKSLEEKKMSRDLALECLFDEKKTVINTHIKKKKTKVSQEKNSKKNLIFLLLLRLSQYSAFLSANLQNSHKFDLKKRVAHHKLLRALQHCKKSYKKISKLQKSK